MSEPTMLTREGEGGGQAGVPVDDSRLLSLFSRLFRPRAPRSLAARAGTYMAFVLVISLVSSVGIVLLMTRSWMMWQLDDSLRQDVQRLVENAGDSEGFLTDLADTGNGLIDENPPNMWQRRGGSAPYEAPQPEPSEGSLYLVAEGGHARARLVQRFHVFALEAEDTHALAALPHSPHPQDIELPSLGHFRAVVHEAEGVRYVSAKGTGEITRVMMGSAGTALAILLLSLLLATVSVRHWVRKELHPLGEVVSVARTVGGGVLVNNEDMRTRVDTRGLTRGSEVGDVGYALNTLLDNVEEAFAARDESEGRLRQFIADASHELRTPIASISGYAQLMGQHAIDNDNALERIGAESARMSELIEDLLLLARLDAGREVAREEVDLIPLAIDAISDAHAAEPGNEWQILVDAEAADQCTIMGEESALRQVLANLLSNARVHTPTGTRIICEVARVADRGVLRISDNGPGIPAELQAKVFDRFIRGDASRARLNQGSSGLGLSIVQAIVDAHDGTIRLDSSEQGTTVTVSFPTQPGLQ